MKKKNEGTEITVMQVSKGIINFQILGTSPLIYNAMSEKVKAQLLCPPQKKNAADKASMLKHDPIEEFRGSVYRFKGDDTPTLLGLPAACFKACMSNAALDMPGASKSQIGRLTYVEGDMIEIYGIPQMKMDVVRMADMSHTPDIRTRAILTEWACKISISFVQPLLRDQAVVNLLAAGGITQGVGDYRPQKGKGNFGQFALVGADDKDFARIVKASARKAQTLALKDPEFYDVETESLYRHHQADTKRRGFKVA
jgi:hypothetical protein